jgi:hypothetical protein
VEVVADDHQTFHYLVVAVACQAAWNLKIQRPVHH